MDIHASTRTRRRRRRSFWLTAFGAFALARAGALAADSTGSLDVTKYGVVWRVPAMSAVSVEAGLAFGDGERRFDLYRPPALEREASVAPRAERAPLPALVFVNVTGAPFQEWEIYRDWARLVAAHGIAGIVYQNDPSDATRSLSALFAHLRGHAAELGIDPARIAIWACSANVSLALPWLNGARPPEVAAAVLYYGNAQVPQLRTDLPVFYVLAERDSPQLKAGIRELFAQAVRKAAPWTMVEAPTLTHAFDALDQGVDSQRLVQETVAWLVARLVTPPAPGPAPDLARQALLASYGQEFAASEQALREILAGHPDDRAALSALGSVLARSGQDAAAIPVLRQAQVAGESGLGLSLQLGQALVRTGELDAGFAELAKAVAAGANPNFVYNQLGVPAMQRGEMATAIRIWERALAGPNAMPAAGSARGVVLYNLACAYARAGQAEPALDRLGQAISAGFGPRATVEEDDDLASLRTDPRFAALLDKIAATP